ncbi:DUF1932 domain-containing protein [Billgrantia desiderata]|uniref:DUF1932 domain-containing protein n=1 Tax=Billgrantia desiderata TaxID=52021 RepID=UPI003F3581DC
MLRNKLHVQPKHLIITPAPPPSRSRRPYALVFSERVVSGEVGVASAIKMCRSVMIKGLEALTTECLFTARHYGAEEEVLASLQASFPGMGWDAALPHYLISRVAEHGWRRAEEMEEVAETVRAAGGEPHMSQAIAKVQRGLVEAMAIQGLNYNELEPFNWHPLVDRLTATRARR